MDSFGPTMTLSSSLMSTQRHLKQSPIKKLERHHLNGALVTIVICEFYQWQELFPMLLLVHHVHVQPVFQDLVCSFVYPSVSV
jgi:hypothetical protein